MLWAEMDFALKSLKLDEEMNEVENGANLETLCKHDLILDEQMGIKCRFCSFIKLEIRYVLPPMAKFASEGLGRKSSYSGENVSMFDGGQFGTSSPILKVACIHTNRKVFEFIWKNLAGTTEVEKLKSSDPDNVVGCTYFTCPWNRNYCSGQPTSHLGGRVQKWNIGVPFHNLNSLEFSGKESAVIVKFLDRSRHQTQNKNDIRMVKLFSWCKDKSILGVSYSLYESLLEKNSERMTEPRREVRLLVLDEGHTPRNQRSSIWKVLCELQTKKRIILSGTPFQNNFLELYNTLCLVRPGFADTIPSSLKKLCQRRLMREKRVKGEVLDSTGNSTGSLADEEIKQFKALMAPFVHVHKGSILQKNLPGLRDCVVVLNPPDLQKRLLEGIRGTSNTFEFEHRLALASVHPSLFQCMSLTKKEESILDQDCQFIDPLCLIMDQLSSLLSWCEGRELLYMHGKLDQKTRQFMINKFNDPNSEAKVLLASTKACSEGINLVGASRVVLLDVVWNPSVERQAISRAYRIGQKKVVYTYHLITRGTTECDKYCKQAEKDRLSELVFSSEMVVSSTNKENDKQKSPAVVSDDKVLDEMIRHDKLKDMFEKIIYQPKESDLVESFGSMVLP
ncbi:hypothetical protein RGQ29_032309 [Quercus rubra]|uniref:Uncharacterized protein n=1 Tax=Quercus rubra TaxID=3512 RepID=A0AAN7DSB5_QUERU|nr:hypothetical protein RGQ29_032309 [Quercus rubra]